LRELVIPTTPRREGEREGGRTEVNGDDDQGEKGRGMMMRYMLVKFFIFKIEGGIVPLNEAPNNFLKMR